MATRKRRGNLFKKRDRKYESSDEEVDATGSGTEYESQDKSTESEEPIESSDDLERDTSFEDSKVKSESDDMDQAGTMSLDVLAQVAADRLEKDPGPSSRSSNSKKMSKRSLLNMDFLHLDQIRTLSPKFLVNLFAEMNSNEITRNYSYTCYIIPEKCNAVYTSFGSEIRARDLIKSHLQKHVEDLVKLKTANEGFSFIAETVVAKKKREIAEKSMRKRKAWNVGISKKAPLKLPTKSKASTIKKLTGLKATKPKSRKLSNKNEVHVNVSIVKKPRCPTNPSGAPNALEGDFPMILHDEEMVIPVKAQVEEVVEDASDLAGHSKADGEWDIIDEKTKVPFKRTGRNVERNENIIWDILCASQPYHDHSYTTVFGKRKAGQALAEMDLMEMDEEIDEESRPSSRTSGMKFSFASPVEPEANAENSPVVMKVGDEVENKLHIPIVKLEIPQPQDGNVTPDVLTVNRPYPPMPKSDLAQKGRLMVPEEQASSSEEDVPTTMPLTAVSLINSSKKRDKRKLAEGTLEWERRLALKCIRELRLRKKVEDTRLVCKICKDKTFTATATLMYHYRSHAGIKPFVCLICNTTFTRQHSLNYHMLIHNNQSRFTCVDCGRKFRHPSHFKEHLRRHTGETPFHCMDCPLRFKTRNTYKRHLKTRHGKLLTANGIRIMPREEFLKVRSKYATKESNDLDEDEDYDDEEDDDEMTNSKYDDDVDPDAEIDLEGLDSDSTCTDSITANDTESRLASSPPPQPEPQLAQAQTFFAVPISSQATVAVPVQAPADQNLSALTDTSASNKLLQLCSQVVQQEAG